MGPSACVDFVVNGFAGLRIGEISACLGYVSVEIDLFVCVRLCGVGFAITG